MLFRRGFALFMKRSRSFIASTHASVNAPVLERDVGTRVKKRLLIKAQAGLKQQA